jgi:hypothetical protein
MSINLVPLSLETICEVKGGLVALMVEKALTRLAMDIEAAPDIAEFRKVTIEIRAKPVMENLELSHVITEFAVRGKVPDRVTSASMCVRSNERGIKQLCFNLDAQDNPQQHTLLPAGRDMHDADSDDQD